GSIARRRRGAGGGTSAAGDRDGTSGASRVTPASPAPARSFQAVAVAGDGGDPVAPAELGPQPADEQVHALGRDVVVAVHLVQYLLSRQRDAGVPDEVLQQAELQ